MADRGHDGRLRTHAHPIHGPSEKSTARITRRERNSPDYDLVLTGCRVYEFTFIAFSHPSKAT